MKFLSVCSGIEAASVAWHDLGFECVGVSEIDKFPSEVLKYHYPSVPNLGDMTKYKEWNNDLAPDLLVGGTPCQSFSVAGLRKGMDDPRGNLALTYVGIAAKYKPQWFIWENVPGVLSSNGGKDFSSFLSAMADIGYGIAYRVLDAQFFGVPQRRRRVFVVGYLGDWRPAAATLLERESLSRNDPPSRAKREEENTEYSGECFSFSGQSLTAYDVGSPSPTLDTGCSHFNRGVHIAYSPDVYGRIGKVGVRRLSVVECERLQGLPENYTQGVSDTQRYKMIGNGFTVDVVAHILKGIRRNDNIIRAFFGYKII